MTALLTVVGISLFVLIGTKAVKQIADRQYIVGKQRTASGVVSSGVRSGILTAGNSKQNINSLSVAPEVANVPAVVGVPSGTDKRANGGTNYDTSKIAPSETKANKTQDQQDAQPTKHTETEVSNQLISERSKVKDR